MKKYSVILSIAIFFAFLSNANAQLEIKLDPLNTLFGSPQASVEYIINSGMGIEAIANFETKRNVLLHGEGNPQKKQSLTALWKYYVDQKIRGDKFYVGLYGNLTNLSTTTTNAGEETTTNKSDFGTGLALGYKWIGKSKIIFEFSGGFGRSFEFNSTFTDVDVFMRAAFGYRF